MGSIYYLVDDKRGLIPHQRVAGVAPLPRQLLLLLVLLQGLFGGWGLRGGGVVVSRAGGTLQPDCTPTKACTEGGRGGERASVHTRGRFVTKVSCSMLRSRKASRFRVRSRKTGTVPIVDLIGRQVACVSARRRGKQSKQASKALNPRPPGRPRSIIIRIHGKTLAPPCRRPHSETHPSAAAPRPC